MRFKKMAAAMMLASVMPILWGCGGMETGEETVGTALPASAGEDGSMETKDTQDEEQEKEQHGALEKIPHRIGETVGLVSKNGRSINVTLTGWGSTSGEDGTVVLFVEYMIENTGMEAVNVGPSLFSVYADDQRIEQVYGDSDAPDQGSLSGGKKLEGTFYAGLDPVSASVIEAECGSAVFLIKDGKEASYEIRGEEDKDSTQTEDVVLEGETEDAIEEVEKEDTDDGYILLHSDSEELTVSDLKGLSAIELTYARNEIYARHGYVFQSPELNRYFEGMDWYEPDTSFDGTLTGVEKVNAGFISDYQNENGLAYKPE